MGSTELESVTSCVSSRRSNQLSYEPGKEISLYHAHHSASDSATGFPAAHLTRACLAASRPSPLENPQLHAPRSVPQFDPSVAGDGADPPPPRFRTRTPSPIKLLSVG